ncbi:hypothetical protein V2Z46_004304 [Salmonella enterica]|uniref:Uncharacterized protein n=1 Tax=Salmonella enterica TaxID=28901 RepID=A0A629ZUI8_SALER|nr:hypothetical protein [Salmonella enterica]EBH8318557.1 hypothetical protein [Salmonella enterica subsp. enterica serovar Javiana]ECY7798190.1 hypothetical protein [Salmonella enterica subsp. enterica serovar Itami]EDK0704936.1 hypothetical protein [Salmonella bongori]EDK3135732.1 hypothetical protein [Salmonella enterica subsp. enterica serovar Newport]EDT6424949.1 hypothetical protein [Salmonella enterica subsp. enterica]EDT8313374.1 hypothetical protein [Salmonella enterica subsp. enteri
MLVSKKKYDFLLDRYEQSASRADLLERLAFVDRWISGLLPALTRQISIQEWQEMLDICSADHAYGMSHHQSQGETR